ncbi:MAG: hypothetical protein PHO53_02560 [Actinomycetota bacterium]|nr:hypothetical protein [Actinomycetota bacterium]
MADSFQGGNGEIVMGNKRKKVITKLLMAFSGVILCIAVSYFGWYQFRERASVPIDIVKGHELPGSNSTVEERIDGFLSERGIKVNREAFAPRWGAEQKDGDVWIVSYVFEVGRNATWLSWEVNVDSGDIRPIGELARELWIGEKKSGAASGHLQ